MPWEMSRQGLLKHLLNEGMNTRMETVDAYMQIIPPGSRSGKHRQLAESCLYVVEGRGYDLHQDCDVEITDTYHWKAQDEVKRFEWEAGDVIYVPPNTICQHFNADPERPVRLIVAVNRIYKQCGLERSRAARGRARIRSGRDADAGRRGEVSQGQTTRVKRPLDRRSQTLPRATDNMELQWARNRTGKATRSARSCGRLRAPTTSRKSSRDCGPCRA